MFIGVSRTTIKLTASFLSHSLTHGHQSCHLVYVNPQIQYLYYLHAAPLVQGSILVMIALPRLVVVGSTRSAAPGRRRRRRRRSGPSGTALFPNHRFVVRAND